MMIRSVLLVLQNNEIYELLVSGLNNSWVHYVLFWFVICMQLLHDHAAIDHFAHDILLSPVTRRVRYCFIISVRMSSAGIVSKGVNIVMLFSHSGRGVILVFEPDCRYKIYK